LESQSSVVADCEREWQFNGSGLLRDCRLAGSKEGLAESRDERAEKEKNLADFLH
jgi:hypothetical protein